jgi:hypothetical protein
LANATSWQIGACAEVICSKEVATATFPICQLDRRVCPTDIDKMHAFAGRTTFVSLRQASFRENSPFNLLADRRCLK